MRAGDAPSTVAVPASAVSVYGVSHEVVSVQTERSLGGGGVPGLSQSAAAEGSVEWAQKLDALAGAGPSPWRRAEGLPPVVGTAVQASVGTVEGGLHRALTGVVDTSEAGSDGAVVSSIIDPIDQLHRRVTVPPMLGSMPPHTSGGPLRRVGLSSDYIVDLILRYCRFWTTPLIRGGGVSVPGQGSLWPDRGTCLTASGRNDPTGPANFQATEWGAGIYSAAATYAPAGSIRISDGLDIGAMVSGFHGATARVSMHAGGHRFDLLVASTMQVQARHYDGTTVTSVSLPATSGWRRVKASFTASGMTISTDDGRTATGTHTAPSAATSAAVESVEIVADDGARLGGIVAGVCHDYLTQPLNAVMSGWGQLDPRLTASPAITDRDALDVIGEIADATCRAYWWDEDGVFTWLPGDVLMARTPVATLTSLDNIYDWGWSESITDTHARVVVSHDVAAINLRTTPSATVWQGRGESMGSTEVVEEFVAPPADEDWVMVDANPLNASANHELVNRATRSVVGGVRTDGTSWRWGSEAGLLTTSMQPITQDVWKLTHTTGVLPAGQTMQLAFPDKDADTTIWQHWRSENLPIIRAYARVQWAEDTVTAGNGPPSSGDYSHNGGRWLRGVGEVTPGKIAEFLASWLCVPRYRATGVQVVHDPRIQVGDVVTVEDRDAHGVTLTALVTRIAQTTTPDDQDMTLDLFIIDGAPSDYTLGDHTAAQGSTSLAGHTTGRGSETLAAHTAAPSH